jgi:hypothetical protein
MDLEQMLILTPGVFIQKLKEMDKVFPIEIYLGGSIGNNGIHSSYFHGGNMNGVITLFFES